MASSPQAIHLRRPPAVVLQEGTYVPRLDSAKHAEVERRWGAMCDSGMATFDGRVCHVLGVHRNGHGGATIHAVDCAYRFYAVQDDDFDLGIRPLGVKGLVVHEGLTLVGHRSSRVSRYQGMKEFAPGGTVEPGVEPTIALQQELAEETGLVARSGPTAMAILFDACVNTWEVIYRIEPDTDRTSLSAEHDSFEWLAIDNLRSMDDFSPISRIIADLFRRHRLHGAA